MVITVSSFSFFDWSMTTKAVRCWHNFSMEHNDLPLQIIIILIRINLKIRFILFYYTIAQQDEKKNDYVVSK